MAAPLQPIIVIKKKGGHGGHHGGAWKVAYADFVTAMMALFIVLWLMHASPEVQKAVGGYFNDPKGTGTKTGTNVGGSGEALTINKQNMEQLKEKLQKAIQKSPEFQKLQENVQMTITSEGLRIELVETEKGIFFESGQLFPTGTGKDLLVKLAQELGKLKSAIALEGHTDSQPYGKDGYTNWELSADRANAARRIMQAAGLSSEQVSQVRGFADQQLRIPARPEDPSNRRVSIIVQFSSKGATAASDENGPGGAKPGTPIKPSESAKSEGAKYNGEGAKDIASKTEPVKPETQGETKAKHASEPVNQHR